MPATPIVAIIDDDEGVRTSLASLIRSLGCVVRVYASAIDFLEDGSADPDCLISDIQMPQMTGDQLQAVLVSAGRTLPIVFMTAFPSDKVRDRVMSAGAVAYLAKPADSAVLVKHIAAIPKSR